MFIIMGQQHVNGCFEGQSWTKSGFTVSDGGCATRW